MLIHHKIVCLLVVATYLVAPVVAFAEGHNTLAHGRTLGDDWRVTVESDGNRRGICLEAVVGQVATGRCSFPAIRRGLIRTAVTRYKTGRPRVTVVGAAFNSHVQRVVAIGFDRTRRPIPILEPPPGLEAKLRKFGYLVVVRKGLWCIKELITESAENKVLWRAPASEIVPYDVGRFCH